MQGVIDDINKTVTKYLFLEFSVVSYNNGELIIGGSEDFCYYHNFEIIFKNVFTINGNLEWKVNAQNMAVEILKESTEAIELNKKYRVEQGYTIFKFTSEENLNIYVIAEDIVFKNEIVKYHAG